MAMLLPIQPTSVNVTAGTATIDGAKVTMTSAENVSLNGIFSADYGAYRIHMTFTHTGASQPQLRLRASGTDTTTGYGYAIAYGNGGSNTLGGASSQPAMILGSSGDGLVSSVVMDVYQPFLNTKTNVRVFHTSTRFNVDRYESASSYTTNAVFDGVTFKYIAFTGEIYVYGFAE